MIALVWSLLWRVGLLALAARAVYTVLEMVDERNADRRAFGDALQVKQFRAENVWIAKRRHKEIA